MSESACLHCVFCILQLKCQPLVFAERVRDVAVLCGFPACEQGLTNRRPLFNVWPVMRPCESLHSSSCRLNVVWPIVVLVRHALYGARETLPACMCCCATTSSEIETEAASVQQYGRQCLRHSSPLYESSPSRYLSCASHCVVGPSGHGEDFAKFWSAAI